MIDPYSPFSPRLFPQADGMLIPLERVSLSVYWETYIKKLSVQIFRLLSFRPKMAPGTIGETTIITFRGQNEEIR